MKRKRHYLIIAALGLLSLLLVFINHTARKTLDEKEPIMNKSNKYYTYHNQELTDLEKYVIEDKGTESPFIGKYNDHFEKGIYVCKRCGKALFESDSKFASHCGWPSFDDQIPGAVKKVPDADGRRTEILCNNCGAHLGHVFTGEQLTDKNTRYCVNSVSMDFIAASERETARAIFAAGCFWGVQYYLQQTEGVISTTVGFAGGQTDEPSYREVSAGKTGHAEAVEVVYDPRKVNYEQLAKLFFEIHDFTQLNRQGPDIGSQYRSVIFYSTPEEKQTAEEIIRVLEKKGYDVKTEIKQAEEFWPAEQYHQDYYEKNQHSPYCHVRKKIFDQ